MYVCMYVIGDIGIPGNREREREREKSYVLIAYATCLNSQYVHSVRYKAIQIA